MTKRFILFAVFLAGLCFSAQGHAADSQAQPTQVPPEAAAAPAPLLRPQEGIGKQYASSPVTKIEAEKYYLNCVNNVLTLQDLNPYQRDYLCSCVSAGLPVSMTSVELKDMTLNVKSPAGQEALHHFMTEVYMPCAMQPLKEVIWSECTGRAGKNGQFSASANKRCQCFSKNMMSYIDPLGIAEAEYNLSKSYPRSEPFDTLIGASGYKQEQYKSYMTCFDGLMP